MVTSDAHEGWDLLEEAFLAVSHGNVATFISSRMRVLMSLDRACELKWLQISVTIFNAPDRSMAEKYLQRVIQKYAKSAPRLSSWLEANLAEGFTFFDFPTKHRRFIRTTNSLERVNREIRRRTRVVGIFPNEASCLRLISAKLMEISEEWQIGKHFCASKILNC